MFSLFVIPVVLQIAVPIGLVVWQAAGRDAYLVSWFLKHGAVWSYIYATSLVGVWLLAPWYTPYVLLVISLSLGARQLMSSLTLWRTPRTYRQWLGLGTRASLALITGTIVVVAARSGEPPERIMVGLAFPLRAGDYYIVNGGSAALVNAHLMSLTSERFRAYRGQSYGIDIIGLNRFGVHSSFPAPRDPARYTIFGERVYAPCEGIVARSEDGLPDIAPRHPDREHMAGNYVLVECGEYGDFHVLLGHLRLGSVRVHPGDYVTTDTLLGQAGNSGNSNEPHLHIHAQRPGRPWEPFDGDPLPMRFDGRFLVRNDRVMIATTAAEEVDD